MGDFSTLSSVAQELYFELKYFYFMFLPLFLSAAIFITWLQGTGDFVDKVKRVFVATLLLIAFPEITNTILVVTNGLANHIDDMSGIENIMKIAGDKFEKYEDTSFKSLLIFGDLLLATLSYFSYLILYCARFIMLAIYHFSWAFLTILAPIILLFHVFSSKMTINLFKNMTEIASWKIVWAILSFILKALPWGDTMALGGNYLTLFVMNFVIALCMVATPLVVRSFVGAGFTAFASSLTPLVAMSMVSIKAKAMSIGQKSSNLIK